MNITIPEIVDIAISVGVFIVICQLILSRKIALVHMVRKTDKHISHKCIVVGVLYE